LGPILNILFDKPILKPSNPFAFLSLIGHKELGEESPARMEQFGGKSSELVLTLSAYIFSVDFLAMPRFFFSLWPNDSFQLLYVLMLCLVIKSLILNFCDEQTRYMCVCVKKGWTFCVQPWLVPLERHITMGFSFST